MTRMCRLGVLACLAMLAARPPAAQVSTGEIFGRVVDGSGAVIPEVTVTGVSPVVDTKSVTLGTNFGKELLESIPSARDPWVIIEQTPGMVMDRQNVGGSASGQQASFGALGSSSNQTWNMDGATITD